MEEEKYASRRSPQTEIGPVRGFFGACWLPQSTAATVTQLGGRSRKRGLRRGDKRNGGAYPERYDDKVAKCLLRLAKTADEDVLVGNSLRIRHSPTKFQRFRPKPKAQNCSQLGRFERMSAPVKTIAAALDRAALRFPSRLAVVSPFQTSNSAFTYEELSQTSNALAGFLKLYGFDQRDLLISDLPNTTENLLLQLACNRLGVYYGTTKNLEGLARFPKVKGAVSATNSGFLAETSLPLPYLSGEFLVDLIDDGKSSQGTSLSAAAGASLNEFSLEDYDQEAVSRSEQAPHAFYNSTSAYTNQQALQHGKEAAEELVVIEQDVVCVSITLCHAFGMGSAVGSALERGACIALPAVGGIQGCGVPSERAAATFEVLESEKCTLLFADTHTLKALPDHPERLNLRGGVCKIGSGSDWLDETREYGGIRLKTLGKRG